MKPWANTIEVHVYNTAVNLLVGRPASDDFGINSKYGKRFERQDMDQIRSLASGLFVAPALRFAERCAALAGRCGATVLVAANLAIQRLSKRALS